MSVQIARRIFTVDEYHRMGEAGIFSVNDHLELIEGEIVRKSRISSRHAASVNRLSMHLNHLVRDSAIVSIQDPIVLNDFSEPEPDIALLKPRDDFYAQAHPKAADVLLIIEVADTSVDYDRDIKLPAYARSGVPEVWLADLPTETVTAYTEPANGVYRSARAYQRGDSITPLHFPELSIQVTSILG
jgi:Uma2 family endonuclease